MATKTTLRAEIRARRRGRRAFPGTSIGARSSDTDQAPLPVRHRAEAEGIAFQVRALASSMGSVALPALFVPTPLEPDLSLTLGLFPRVLLPVLVDEAGAISPGFCRLRGVSRIAKCARGRGFSRDRGKQMSRNGNDEDSHCYQNVTLAGWSGYSEYRSSDHPPIRHPK